MKSYSTTKAHTRVVKTKSGAPHGVFVKAHTNKLNVAKSPKRK